MVVVAIDAIVTPTTAIRTSPQGSPTYSKIVSKTTGNPTLKVAIYIDTFEQIYNAQLPKNEISYIYEEKITPNITLILLITPKHKTLHRQNEKNHLLLTKNTTYLLLMTSIS